MDKVSVHIICYSVQTNCKHLLVSLLHIFSFVVDIPCPSRHRISKIIHTPWYWFFFEDLIHVVWEIQKACFFLAGIWERCLRLMRPTTWCPYVVMMPSGNFLPLGKVVVSFSYPKMTVSWSRHCENSKSRFDLVVNHFG